MNTQQWLDRARIDQDKLRSLIANYHPLTRGSKSNIAITAPNAERACQEVREHIKRNSEGDPVVKFNIALEESNWKAINLILNETWFGVPESTLAWQLEGFKEAIILLEELPDDVS
jgi:hypothetical protein